MKRGSTILGSLRVVAVACLCVAVAAAVQFGPYFVKMMKVYQEGPSIGGHSTPTPCRSTGSCTA